MLEESHGFVFWPRKLDIMDTMNIDDWNWESSHDLCYLLIESRGILEKNSILVYKCLVDSLLCRVLKMPTMIV